MTDADSKTNAGLPEADELDLPVAAEVFAAAERIAGRVHRTPLLTSSTLNALLGADLYFKAEHLQKVGAFKARGAANAVLQLPAGTEIVATHSSGNHGAALAWAAAEQGLRCKVVMPENAPQVKKAAVAAYGAEIVFCEPTLAAREAALAELVQSCGAHVVPPFDDARIIAGQGTVAQEVVAQCRELGFVPDLIVAPVGGGGLLAGVGLAASALAPDIRVLGAEPAGADDAQRSFRTGTRVTEQVPDTIADGLRTTLGVRNFALIRACVSDVVTVSEVGIREALALLWGRTKQFVEPSAAVGLAAVMEHPARFRNKRAVIVLTGGNMDIAATARLVQGGDH